MCIAVPLYQIPFRKGLKICVNYWQWSWTILDSGEDEYDENLPMDKHLCKDETFGKTEETNVLNIPIPNSADITGSAFLMPPQ